MTEKEIIQHLIKAFEYARQRIEADYFAKCICPQVKDYIFSITGLTHSDKLHIVTYFYSFFSPVKLGLKEVYRFNIWFNRYDVIPVDEITGHCGYYWFPMTIGFKPNRINICNKAINLLEENLKELNGRGEQEAIEGEQ